MWCDNCGLTFEPGDPMLDDDKGRILCERCYNELYPEEREDEDD